MMYYFLPMKEKSDFGFGLVASSFLAAADRLKDDKFAQGFEYLPICYLRRHSIELFLKSFIILLHKNYKIDYGDVRYSSDKPRYKGDNSTWHDLYKEHNLLKLYTYFKSLVDIYYNDIIERTYVTDWPFFNNEYKENIRIITDYDNHSDYFRYPMSRDMAKDKRKQLSRKVTFEEATAIMKKQKGIFLAFKNDAGEITSLYSTQSNQNVEEIKEVLENVAYHFDCFHTALRVTMFDGL
jgi:hypothetical protein